MPVAVPLIGLAASGIGSLISKKSQQSAMKRSPEEQTALTGGQQAAGQLATTGQQLTTAGTENVGAGSNYYQALLHGNRALQAQATAAPRASITDTYAGAQRGLEQSGVRGAEKDVAAGELQRQKAGQIASLVTGVQPGAASALTQTGLEQTGQGGQRTGAAGGIYENLLGKGFQNRVYGRAEGEKTGSAVGGLVFDALSGAFGKKFGGGGGGLLGSRQTTPNMGFMPTGSSGMSGY